MVRPGISLRVFIPWVKSGLRFVFLSTLFALVYSQSPLYTSNQNHYFLHGLAQSGVGNLQEDWLVDSPDPMPVFSALVCLSIATTGQSAWFYIFYALIMGVYFVSMLSIIEKTFPQRPPDSGWLHPQWLVYISLFLLIHSAAWRFALSRSLGPNWIYLVEDGVADQRLLGTVFQPSVFGVLLVASIACFLKSRPTQAALCAALAAIFHPTYLLSAAILVAIYILLNLHQTIKEAKNHGQQNRYWSRVTSVLLPGFIALAITIPILVYVMAFFSNSPAQYSLEANRILAEYRIPHHASAQEWFDSSAIVKIVIFILALFITRKTRLFAVLLLAGIVTTILTIFQIVSDNQALALLFPWRSSIFLIPISSVIILAWGVQAGFHRLETLPQITQNRARNHLLLSAALLVFILIGVGVVRTRLDFQRQQLAVENSLYSYANSHSASGQVYLIPIKMQDFRLRSGVPVYVDFKSHPYYSADVIEWRRRLKLAESFYRQGDCDLLPSFVSEGVTHIVVPRLPDGEVCPGVDLLYQDDHYLVFAP
jgi:hypothetical protein